MGDNVSFCSIHGNVYEGWKCPYCERGIQQPLRCYADADRGSSFAVTADGSALRGPDGRFVSD